MRRGKNHIILGGLKGSSVQAFHVTDKNTEDKAGKGFPQGLPWNWEHRALNQDVELGHPD